MFIEIWNRGNEKAKQEILQSLSNYKRPIEGTQLKDKVRGIPSSLHAHHPSNSKNGKSSLAEDIMKPSESTISPKSFENPTT